MKQTHFSKAAFAVIAVALAALPAEAGTSSSQPPAAGQVAQAPALPVTPLDGLAWRLPPRFATLEAGRLVIDIPAGAGPADALAEADLAPALLLGAEGFSVEVSVEGEKIVRGNRDYYGLKIQLHWTESATGREGWENIPNVSGTFQPRLLRNDAWFKGARSDRATLQLGLQGSTGRVVFDLSTLRGGRGLGLFRPLNQDKRVAYPERVLRDARRRGFMLPGRDPTEDDFATLAEWGANIVRFQMVRDWGKPGSNSDLDEFAGWLDSRLDVLERVVLPLARRHGMKVVLDFHVTPGGRAVGGELPLFYEPRYAEFFVNYWRRIAARFVGNEDVIYGYDLVPEQLFRAAVDYWTLQRMAAEAIREIDPATPIVVEANHWDSPDGFRTLSPLAIDNVIYQVHMYQPDTFTHQGVGKRPVGIRWPDESKGWNRDYLRATLAPVREFQLRHDAKIYVGEFSAIAWAPGAEEYLRECIDIFEEYGWDWTYHAFREWDPWSLEREPDGPNSVRPSADNPRKRVVLEALRKNVAVRPGDPQQEPERQ